MRCDGKPAVSDARVPLGCCHILHWLELRAMVWRAISIIHSAACVQRVLCDARSGPRVRGWDSCTLHEQSSADAWIGTVNPQGCGGRLCLWNHARWVYVARLRVHARDQTHGVLWSALCLHLHIHNDLLPRRQDKSHRWTRLGDELWHDGFCVQIVSAWHLHHVAAVVQSAARCCAPDQEISFLSVPIIQTNR